MLSSVYLVSRFYYYYNYHHSETLMWISGLIVLPLALNYLTTDQSKMF